MDEKKLSDTALKINGAIGDLADLCFEKIQESLKAFDLPEPVAQAISNLADNATMLNLYIANGSPYVKHEDLGNNVAEICEALIILDKACSEKMALKEINP